MRLGLSTGPEDLDMNVAVHLVRFFTDNNVSNVATPSTHATVNHVHVIPKLDPASWDHMQVVIIYIIQYNINIKI